MVFAAQHYRSRRTPQARTPLSFRWRPYWQWQLLGLNIIISNKSALCRIINLGGQRVAVRKRYKCANVIPMSCKRIRNYLRIERACTRRLDKWEDAEKLNEDRLVRTHTRSPSRYRNNALYYLWFVCPFAPPRPGLSNVLLCN